MSINEGDFLLYLIAGGFTILLGGVVILGYLSIRKNSNKLAYDEQLKDLLEDENDPDYKPAISLSTRWNQYWSTIARESGMLRYNTADNSAGRDVVLLALVAGVVVSLATKNFIAGLIIAVVIVFLISVMMKTLSNKKVDALNAQLPGFLFALKANVQANETSEKAILKVIDGMPSPLYDDIVIVKHRLLANSSFKDALEELSMRTASRDLKFLCSCMIQASSAGANLEEQITTIQKVLENRQRVSDELSKAVKSVSTTIWVASIAIPGMFFVTYFMDAAARAFWFVDPFSWAALAIVAVFWGVGLYSVKRLVDGVKNL